MSKLVSIRYFQHTYETAVLKTLLDKENIPYFFKDENMTQTMPFYTFGSGGIQLQVWEEDVERAKKLLIDTGYLEREIEMPSQEERLEEYADRVPYLRTMNKEYKIVIAAIIIMLLVLLAAFG